MARITGVIAPGIPHHIVQRGNRRQDVFLKPGDPRVYLAIPVTEAERITLKRHERTGRRSSREAA